MKTRFYKILYKNKDVVYVGVTTRVITERFREHLISKGLNKNYSIVEFDCIEHPEFSTLDIYYTERRKVVELEQKYIREELERGSHLLNISKGGEWGSQILEKLRKEEFCKKFGSYDNYAEYKKNMYKGREWLRSWIRHRSENKVKVWVRNWTFHKRTNRTHSWVRNWVSHRSINKTKRWIRNWIFHRSTNRTHSWIKNWVHNKSKNNVKTWVYNWISGRSMGKAKVWIKNWIIVRSQNRSKVWLHHWVERRNTKRTKIWVRHWVGHRSENNVKGWARNWVNNRS